MNDKGAYQALVVARLENEDLEKRPLRKRKRVGKKERTRSRSYGITDMIWEGEAVRSLPESPFTPQHYPPAPLACSPA